MHEEEARRRRARRRGPSHTRAATSADAGGEHDQHRLEDELELRHAEVELALEGREPDQEAAGQRARGAAQRAAQRAAAAAPRASAARALDEQHGQADERHRRAADQHQVRRAPERHVLAEQPVPDVVEREAEQREARRSAKISTPPSGAYQSR